ncbi:pentatricopeptide repeat-containing protein At2g13600-like [Phoenix dactylifera]|uniref:Pentatricopeptide repeat-containing protein At2g13600-like n=1 Tax=Phoenix dactylifera TaxID=42345 RepID=A0A8B7C475_PHODC|nr:pentatricopeptide repeat-containing protein At2g13600-like [Phoenix dactylifera]
MQLSRYINKGDLNSARQLFDAMPQRTVVSWNAMISGFAKWGRTEEALTTASAVHRSGMKLNETTFSSLLSACARSGSLHLGKQTHCLVFKSGSEDFELVGSALLNFYTSCFDIHAACQLFDLLHGRNPSLWSLMLVSFVRCNLLSDAMDLFDRMPFRDVVSWTALISGYSRSDGECGKALELFLRMKASGEVVPNEFTCDSVLRACAQLGSLDYGKMIHGCLTKFGFELDRSIRGALIDFYCSCDAANDAKRIFEQLDSPCLSTSNALIASLTSMGKIGDAELVFNQMVERNSVSYNLMIKGYALHGRIVDSKSLFEKMPCKNTVSLNAMMSAFLQNGEFEEGLKLFECVKDERNTVTWNSMISGYVHNEQPAEALKLYVVMRHSSIECSRSTFSALFRACAAIGTLQQGRMLHAHLCQTPFDSNAYVGTSLVDMYAKCGNIADARTAFSLILSPNVASWSALINGLSHHGLGMEATLEFGKMLKHRIDPNAVTFVGLLLACSRAGMVDEGMRFFYSMRDCYGLVPTVEHYTCVVDLLGRSGYIREAENFIREMPIEADSVVWGALLSACWFCMDLEVGERVAERMFCLDSNHLSPYVAMSNIYAKLGRWKEVMKVRKRLRDLKVKRDPGCSWIEVKDTVHVFCVEDRNHPQRDDIYAVLEDLVANICFYSESCCTLYSNQNNDVYFPQLR